MLLGGLYIDIFLRAFENNNWGEGWGRQTEDLSSLEAFSFSIMAAAYWKVD